MRPNRHVLVETTASTSNAGALRMAFECESFSTQWTQKEKRPTAGGTAWREVNANHR